jgi:DNA-binding MarR family transcriptional regulator
MTRTVEDLIWEIRRLFRELGQAADKALAPLGVTAAERALLEFLAKEAAPVTLSEIARKRAVSRQHIHQTLSRLNPRWVERTDDPRDARSVFLSLSKEGRALWKQVRRVDGALLQRIEKHLDEKKVRAAAATLQEVREALKSAHEEMK